MHLMQLKGDIWKNHALAKIQVLFKFSLPDFLDALGPTDSE